MLNTSGFLQAHQYLMKKHEKNVRIVLHKKMLKRSYLRCEMLTYLVASYCIIATAKVLEYSEKGIHNKMQQQRRQS
jgi:hypothetical protein